MGVVGWGGGMGAQAEDSVADGTSGGREHLSVSLSVVDGWGRKVGGVDG